MEGFTKKYAWPTANQSVSVNVLSNTAMTVVVGRDRVQHF